MKSTGLFASVLLGSVVSSPEAAVLRRSTATAALQQWKSALAAPDDPVDGSVEDGDVEHLEQSIMSVFSKVQNKSGVDGMVETMKKMVQDDMMPKVTEAHRLAQATLDGLYGAFSTCASAKAVATKSLPDLTKTKGEKSGSHKECRKDEGTKTEKADTCNALLKAEEDGKQIACDAFDNVKATNPNTEADQCHSSSESYGNWLNRLSDWINGLADAYRTADWACGNATKKADDQGAICGPLDTEQTNKKTACDSLQDQLEDTTCKLAIGAKSSCEAYVLCYGTAQQVLGNELPNIEKLEKNRKAEWRALKRMECLLDIWKAGDPKEEEVDACKDKSHDTDDLDISYQTVPDADTCESPTSDPCSAAYIAEEYSSLPQLAPAKDCTTCSGLGSGLSLPSNFHTRCKHDDSWSYVLDYSDDRSIDDLPSDKNAVAQGFSNKNAFYIGNEELEKLDIERAEACVLSSTTMINGQCQWSCFELTESVWGGGTCDACAGFSSNVKRIIAGLSGQMNSGNIIANAGGNHQLASFQGDLSDVWWGCSGHQNLYHWGTGWHKAGWGVSMRLDYGVSQPEVGWYSTHCGWSDRIDPDTLTVRVQLKAAKIVIPSFSKANFGVTTFQERCGHEAGWSYVLDYSDDRTVDDIPNNFDVLKAGFDSHNAYYIGNDKLDGLDIKEAQMCMLSSTSKLDDGKCNWSCKSLADDNHGNAACPTCSDLSSPLKKVIAGLSGQATSGDIVVNVPVGIASFQGDKSNVQWMCHGYKRIYRWGNGWHSEGWGLSVRMDGWSGGNGANQEVGWYDAHCGWTSLNVDTFQIRVKL